MSKIIIAVTAIIIMGGGAYALTRDGSKEDKSGTVSEVVDTMSPDNSDTEAKNELDPNNYTKGAEIGETLDATDKASVNLTISDNIFDTTYLKIKKGTKVTWTNEGSMQHDVTSASSSPKKGLGSDLLSNGESYSFTFNESGIYEYFCTPHASQMKAVVSVVD